MPYLMMKDTVFDSDEFLYDEDENLLYDDEYVLNIILENYKIKNQPDIYDFWNSAHFLDLEMMKILLIIIMIYN